MICHVDSCTRAWRTSHLAFYCPKHAPCPAQRARSPATAAHNDRCLPSDLLRRHIGYSGLTDVAPRQASRAVADYSNHVCVLYRVLPMLSGTAHAQQTCESLPAFLRIPVDACFLRQCVPSAGWRAHGQHPCGLSSVSTQIAVYWLPSCTHICKSLTLSASSLPDGTSCSLVVAHEH